MFNTVLQVAKPGRERRLTDSYRTVPDQELESLLETETDCPAIKKVANSKCPVLAAACLVSKASVEHSHTDFICLRCLDTVEAEFE